MIRRLDCGHLPTRRGVSGETGLKAGPRVAWGSLRGEGGVGVANFASQP